MGRLRHAILTHAAGLSVACLTAFLMLGFTVSSFAEDWPMARHDARNTGRSTDVVQPPLRLAWKVRLGGVGTGTLLASGDVVCIAVRPKHGPWQDTILLDRSGRVVRRLINAVPLYLHGETLIVARLDANRAQIVCEDIRSGTARWSSRLDDPDDHSNQSGPVARVSGGVVAGEVLYLSYTAYRQGTSVSTLATLRVADGSAAARRDWSSEQGDVGHPAVDEGHVYAGRSHWLHVLDRTTLEPQWAHWDGGTSYPMIVENTVVTPGWAHRVQAVDLKNRQLLWRMRAWRDRAHCLAQDEACGSLSIESTASPQVVVAVDISTGKVRWQHALFANDLAASAGRYVFVPGHHKHVLGQTGLHGGLYCLDADSGKLVWKCEKPRVWGRAVAICDGRVYAIIGDDLCAFEGRTSGH